MSNFDKKLLRTKGHFKAYVIVTDLKKIRDEGDSFSVYFNGKLYNHQEYTDKLTGEIRPGHFFINVTAYNQELATKLLEECQTGDLLYITGRPAAFIADKVQKSVKIILTSFEKLTEENDWKRVNKSANEPKGVDDATIVNNLWKEIESFKNCTIEKDENKKVVRVLCSKVHSMSFELRRIENLKYRIYPLLNHSQGSNKKKTSFKIGSIEIGNDQDWILFLTSFINLYKLSCK